MEAAKQTDKERKKKKEKINMHLERIFKLDGMQ